MLPGQYTAGPDEPESWAENLELNRAAMEEVGTYTELEIRRELAKLLAEYRTRRHLEDQVAQAGAEAYMGLGKPPANGAKPEARTASMEVETWMEFRDRSPADISYLVQGLVPEGSLVFLAGAPKAGKTWIGLALALSVSTGKPFLGRFAIPKPAPVLYLALEGHRSAIRARIGAMARGLGADPETEELEWLWLTYRPIGLDLSDPAWAEEVTNHVDQQGARLVIVDVLRAAAPRLRESGEGAGDFAHIRAHLAPLMAAGITVVLLHHFIKTGETSKARGIGERMSGSGALFGHADLVLGIMGKGTDMRLETVSRDAAPPDPFGVILDGHGSTEYGGFGYTDTLRVIATDEVPAAALELWDKAKPIADWILNEDREVTPKEIRERFGVAERTLGDHRDDLERLGITYYSAGRLSTYRPTPRTPRDPAPRGRHADPANPAAPYRGRGVDGEHSADAGSELEGWE